MQRQNIMIDDFVIISDANAICGKWTTGRIVKVLEGSNGLVRNVKVKTATEIYSRPITKICVIYLAEGYEDE